MKGATTLSPLATAAAAADWKIDSRENIVDSSRQRARDLMSSGALMGQMVEYWHLTGDDSYNDVVREGLVHQVGPDEDFMPPNQTRSLGNDDQCHWALAAMTAAESDFQAAEDGPEWIDLAKAVFDTQVSRIDEEVCGGGLRWQIFNFNVGYNYKNTMFNSCSWMNVPNNSGPEVGAIWDGIQKAAAATGVDHRFILAVLMQESGGCVRVHTTNYGVRNPGLMQCHNGDGTCNENGWVRNPCPNDVIYKMISEGTAGTNSGDGLANCINQSGRGDVSAFYRAARIYNSGSISDTGKLENGIATHCYASDIANRLTGWVNAANKCNCDSNPSSCGVVTH
ncbi:hypothetical protein Golomagni_06105 [Golovinomyces magnicellulatus]|nr:hypothetical protein Golomagni_06105 [Golovinomyces magnicellulatus]